MNFQSGSIYHIYNRGNDKQQLYFSDRNYLFFLDKIRKYIMPHCSVLAYCLMPNHFHILIYANDKTENLVNTNSLITKNVLSEGIRLMLSSYTKAINKQEGKTGNLFQQKTKAKEVFHEGFSNGNLNKLKTEYEKVCFDYIHLNPVKAGLVLNSDEWEYSSYHEYFKICNNPLCDKEQALKLQCFVSVPHL